VLIEGGLEAARNIRQLQAMRNQLSKTFGRIGQQLECDPNALKMKGETRTGLRARRKKSVDVRIDKPGIFLLS